MKVLILILVAIGLWDLFTGSPKDFWIILGIIIVIWNYEKILLNIVKVWNLFIRQYNTAYPAFSHYEIGSLWNNMMQNSFDSNHAYERFSKLHEKEKKQGVTANRDFSDKLKNNFKEYTDYKSKSELYKKQADLMIEGNIAVNTGKKIIKQVQEEFEKSEPNYWIHINKAEKEYSEWLNEE